MAAPTLFAQGALANQTGTTALAPVIPTHQADDILVVVTANWVPNTTSGTNETTEASWTKLTGLTQTEGSPINCELSAYWTRATAAGTTIAIVRGSGWDSGNDGLRAARAFVIRGCITTGDPWDAAVAATRVGTANLDMPAVTVSGTERMIVQFLIANDDDGVGAGPGGSWVAGTRAFTTTGTDAEFQTYRLDDVSASSSATASTVAARTAGFYTFFGISFKPVGAVTHEITASGATTSTGSAAIVAVRALTASGATTSTGSAAIVLVTPGTEHPVTASGATTSTGSAAIVAVRALTASGATTSTGSAAIVAVRALTASGATTSTGSAAIVLVTPGTEHPVTASGATTTTGSAAIRCTRTVTASGATTTTGSAAIRCTRTVTASGATTTTGSATIRCTRPVTASGSTTISGSAAIAITFVLAPLLSLTITRHRNPGDHVQTGPRDVRFRHPAPVERTKR